MKRILFVIAILINGSVYVYGQTVGDFQSRQSGNWNDYNTWNRWNGSSWVAAISGQTPGSANSVTIQSSHIITINVAAACTNLSIGGTWSNTGNYTAAISGNLTVNSGATFTAGTGVYTLSGTTKTIGGTITSLTIPSLTISGSYTNNLTGSGLKVTTALGGTGSLTQGANSVLNISFSGTIGISTLTCTATGNTVVYNYTSGVQTVKGTTYYNLKIDNSPQTATLGAATTVSNNLTISSGATLELAGMNLTVSGTAFLAGTIDDNTKKGTNSILNVEFNGGTITSTAASSQIPTYKITGTLNITTGNGIIGRGNFTISGNTTIGTGMELKLNDSYGTKTFGDVTVNGTWTNNTVNIPVTISGTLTVNSGSVFNAGTGVYTLSGTSKTIGGTTTSLTIPNLTVSGSYTNNVNGLNISTALAGAGSLTQGTGAFLNLGGTFAITTLTATANPNTVEYSCTSTGQTLKAITYYNLIIDNGTQTATLGGTTVLNGDLTINSGILQLSTSNLTVAGTTTIVGTITDNSTTGTNSFNNVEFKGGTITGTVTSTYGISGYLNISQGNGTLDASNFNITGTTTIASGKILTISSATGSKSFADVTVNGTWTNSINCPISISGSLTVNSGILFTSGTGIYTLSGTSRSISGTGNFTVSNLTITGSYTNNTNLTIALALAGTGSLTQTANSTLNLGGSISVSGLVASANPNTVIYACTNSAQTIKSTTYYHLTIDNSGQIANGSSGIIVNGNLAVLSGTLADLGYTITGNSSGTFSIASGAAFTTTRTASPFFPSAYTSFNFDNNSTVNFNGAGGHNLPAFPSSYGNIGIGGSGTKVLTAGTTTINGTLIITAGGLQIPENTNLTVKGNFTNNGTFLISSSASGTGSFMDNGTITGTGTYTIQKYLIGGGGTSARWWYLGSSVTAATTAVFNATNVDHGVFTHSQTTGSYTQIKNNTTVLNALQGYAVKFRDADLTANFSGTPNTGIYSINLTGNGSGYGWNLVSNPYPSAIDWDATSGWTKTNVSDVIYYRTNGMYATYNSISGIGTNGGQSYIPAMQGFWVKNISATGTLSVSNAVRLHSNQAYYKSNNKINSSKSNMLRLTAIHSGHKDESVIYFTPNATDGIDNYDTELISNTDTAFAQIYTVVSGKKLSVNSLSQLTKSVSIPLGFKTGNSGIFSISAANIGSFGANVTIILEDILLNKTQILSQNPLYTFTSGVVNDTKRFVIHFNVITGADAGSDVTICNSKATILNGSGGGTYRWSTGSRLRSIAVNPSVTTTYTLTVTSSLGKTSTDNVVVYVNSPIVNAGNDKVICKGNSVTLASTGNGTIKWSNNDTTSAITVSPKVIKIYTVTVSSGGCTASDAVLVRVNSLPVINAGNDLTICGNSHVALNASGNGTFMWNTGQNSTSISVNPSVTSTYTITSTNNNGCSASDQVIVYVVNNCKTNENIIIGETSEFKLFPNPASDVIYFYNNKFNSGNINVKIYNIIGDKLMDKTINTQNTEINVSGLHAGMYSVLITGNGIIYKDIFIKQ